MNNTNNTTPNIGTEKSRRPMVGRGGPMAMMKGEKAKNFKTTSLRLLKSLKPYRVNIIIVFIFAITSTIFSIIGPKVMGTATTVLMDGVLTKFRGTGDIDFSRIASILLTVLGLYAISTLCSYVMGWIMASVSADLTYKFRESVQAKINRIPFKYFDSTTHGETLSRITNDIDTINNTLSQTITQIITSIVTVAGVLIMMLSIDWRMTLVALLMIPLSFALIGLIIGKSQKYFKQQQEYLGHINGQVEEMYAGHTIMKAFNMEEKSLAMFKNINNTLYQSAWKSQFLTGIMMPLMNFVGNLGYVTVAILGGWLAIKKAITVGDIQAFIQYVRNFTQPIQQIANISNVLQQTAAAAERVFEFLDEQEETFDTALPITIEKAQGHVEFRNIHFGYFKDKPIIKNFSTTVHPGQKIAIAGPTGAGKTTLVKLLMRFYDVDDGAILIDGHDIRAMKRFDLRRQFGMVLQDTWLYNDTIMENIRYGRLDATDEEVIAAAKAAYVDHFVHTLPEGYNMVLNEETSNISQGQKQLLTIARAILANPPILILDEATSSVDTRTEVLIQKAMDKLMHGRTSFVIAHRLSTIQNADLILVLRDGNIVEQGTHTELLAQNGFYAELYNSQFEVPVSA